MALVYSWPLPITLGRCGCRSKGTFWQICSRVNCTMTILIHREKCQCSPWLRWTKFPIPCGTVCGLDVLTETVLKRLRHSHRIELAEGYLNYKQISETWQTQQGYGHTPQPSWFAGEKNTFFFLQSHIATWITLSAHKLGSVPKEVKDVKYGCFTGATDGTVWKI